MDVNDVVDEFANEDQTLFMRELSPLTRAMARYLDNGSCP